MTKEKSTLYSGEVHVWVKECKSLPLIRTSIDPYVKWYVGSEFKVLVLCHRRQVSSGGA